MPRCGQLIFPITIVTPRLLPLVYARAVTPRTFCVYRVFTAAPHTTRTTARTTAFTGSTRTFDLRAPASCRFACALTTVLRLHGCRTPPPDFLFYCHTHRTHSPLLTLYAHLLHHGYLPHAFTHFSASPRTRTSRRCLPLFLTAGHCVWMPVVLLLYCVEHPHYPPGVVPYLMALFITLFYICSCSLLLIVVFDDVPLHSVTVHLHLTYIHSLLRVLRYC